ncbi:MerR family transcriptional regulator [Streptococcus didelphis]|uniref:MerR family transcriptional regulator n=1 Tax=Streptococcus didelphis TaxID=102886 RepID=A0ABY9LFU7_9STRE|nr:MerR family transcriptional regulator [Streptococcus didelphis]WMB27790.1 MerR family transcriptional regulator [Streptococcus didelphis]WMB29748.1 MerR family transcriptional regulator [Streptococcus didelphis]
MYLIKEAAQISGVTIRTLHHYDQIGLLKVNKFDNGYRYYTNEDIEKINIIRYYRFLGFSLEKIGKIINEKDFDSTTALQSQLEILASEQKKISLLMENIQRTIDTKKPQITTTFSNQFNGFTILDNIEYQSKALEQFGKEFVIETSKRQKGKELEVNELFNDIFIKFAQKMSRRIQAKEKEVQKMCSELFDILNTYAFDCSLEVFGIIGKTYYNNLEFRKNIDKFGEGLAKYISESIAIFVENQLERRK